jgi:hypothetical protein
VEKIEFTNNGWPYIYDELDAEIIERFTWQQSNEYLARVVRLSSGKRKTILMHREIMGNPDKGLEVDHINRVKNDNRRSNLRIVTRGQNNTNSKNRKSRTGLKGSYPNNRSKTNPYQAKITINKKQTHIGYFETAEKAHEAYLSKRAEVNKGFHIHPNTQG